MLSFFLSRPRYKAQKKISFFNQKFNDEKDIVKWQQYFKISSNDNKILKYLVKWQQD